MLHISSIPISKLKMRAKYSHNSCLLWFGSQLNGSIYIHVKRHISRLCIFSRRWLAFFLTRSVSHFSKIVTRQPIWIFTFSWHSQRLVPSNIFKRCVLFLLTVQRRCFFVGPFLSFMFVYICLCHTALSVPCNLVVTCLGRADASYV